MAKRKKRTPEQIVRKPSEADRLAGAGNGVDEIGRQIGVSGATIYDWRKRYGDMSTDEVKELHRLKDENARLKRLVADKELDILALKEVVEGNWWARLRWVGLLRLCVDVSVFRNVGRVGWWANLVQLNDGLGAAQLVLGVGVVGQVDGSTSLLMCLVAGGTGTGGRGPNSAGRAMSRTMKRCNACGEKKAYGQLNADVGNGPGVRQLLFRRQLKTRTTCGVSISSSAQQLMAGRVQVVTATL